MRAIVLLIACYSLVAVGEPSLGQSRVPNDLVQRARALYKATQWPKSNKTRVGLRLAALKIPGLAGGRLRSDAGYLLRRFVDARSKQELVLVEATIGKASATAQNQLLLWLASRPSADKAVDAATANVQLGTKCYFINHSFKKDRLKRVVFYRDNVAIRVTSGTARTKSSTVKKVALAVDKEIQRTDLLPRGQAPPLPVIVRLDVARRRLPAGARTSIKVVVKDPANGKPNLRWVIGGPAQGYVQQNRNGVWQLHTTRPGKMDLWLEATGSTGTFSRKKIRVTVLRKR